MISYNLLIIKRAIVHKVMAKRKEFDSHVEESKSMVEITTEIETILRTRMTDAFSQTGKAFELAINEVESGSAFSYIDKLNARDDQCFMDISKELAEKLAYCQDRSNIPHGFFVLLDCINTMDGMPVYVLMKAEPHDALEIKSDSARVLKDIILSPSQKMYKAACFQKITDMGSYTDYKVYLFDEQFGTRAQLAEYFYRGFLGLTVNNNDKVLTKMFYFKMLSSIKSLYAKDYEAKDNAEECLKAEMNNKEKMIRSVEVIDRVIRSKDRDYFYRRVMNTEIPPTFRKDTSLLVETLSKTTVSISEDIKLSVSHGLLGADSLYIDKDSDKDFLIVKIPRKKS